LTKLLPKFGGLVFLEHGVESYVGSKSETQKLNVIVYCRYIKQFGF